MVDVLAVVEGVGKLCMVAQLGGGDLENTTAVGCTTFAMPGACLGQLQLRNLLTTGPWESSCNDLVWYLLISLCGVVFGQLL